MAQMISQELEAMLRNLGTTLRRSPVLFQANNFQTIALTFLPLSKGQQR